MKLDIDPIILYFTPAGNIASFSHDSAEDILTSESGDVGPGHFDIAVPEDKQWVSAGDYLGFTADTIVYRWAENVLVILLCSSTLHLTFP